MPDGIAPAGELATLRTGEVLETFTILTTEAHETPAPIHHRMPVIVDPRNFERWLSGGEVTLRSVSGLCARRVDSWGQQCESRRCALRPGPHRRSRAAEQRVALPELAPPGRGPAVRGRGRGCPPLSAARRATKGQPGRSLGAKTLRGVNAEVIFPDLWGFTPAVTHGGWPGQSQGARWTLPYACAVQRGLRARPAAGPDASARGSPNNPRGPSPS